MQVPVADAGASPRRGCRRKGRPQGASKRGMKPSHQVPASHQVPGFAETVASWCERDEFVEKPCPCPNAGLPFTASAEINAFLQLDRASGGVAAQSWGALLASAYPEWIGETVENMLLGLVMRCHSHRQASVSPSANGGHNNHNTESIEYWAGSAYLTLEHFKRGLTCKRFDKTYSPMHDCLHPHGLRLWLDELCRSADKCLVWNGTQCSSFVPLCVHQSKRRPENKFLGDESRAFVRTGNEQMRVLSLIFFVASVLGCMVVLEQPLGSCLPRIELLRLVLQFTRSKRTVTWLGHFGGTTAKPLQLWHTHAAYAQLHRKRPRGHFRVLTVRKGKRYSGKRACLKASQVYTLEFAEAVANITSKARHD